MTDSDVLHRILEKVSRWESLVPVRKVGVELIHIFLFVVAGKCERLPQVTYWRLSIPCYFLFMN
jgi:hypothetical protein